MTNIVDRYNQKQIAKIMQDKAPIPKFKAGDTVCLHMNITSDATSTERIQKLEALCISKRRENLYSSSFIVRKVSDGVGVERILQIYSPKIKKIEVLKFGDVRRANLYYIRKLSGKAARIKKKSSYNK